MQLEYELDDNQKDLIFLPKLDKMEKPLRNLLAILLVGQLRALRDVFRL